MTPRSPSIVFLCGGVALAGLAVWAVVEPDAVASGWLVGFVVWMQILTGSLCLIMIHRLTSGDWGELIAPVVGPAASAIPFLVILAIPLFVAIPALYPWAAEHSPSVKPDVVSVYLNRPAFIARSLVALIGWSGLAFLLSRTRGERGQLLAAIGLVFYALAISSVSIDWYLSAEAPFTSSSFGASVAISSLVAALCWAAIWMPAREDDAAIGDVGALLLTTVLGLTYIDFMAVLVIWYGDLPREELWFVARSRSPWMELSVVAFFLTSLLPVAVLIQSRFRNRRRSLRYIGVVTLIGLVAYDIYLVTPRFGVAAVGPALLATAGIGLVLSGVMPLLAAHFTSSSRETIDAR